MRQRITDLVFCLIGCAVLTLVSFQIWRIAGPPNIIVPPQPEAEEEQPLDTVAAPLPVTGTPKAAEQEQATKVESADNKSVFHLTSFAAPAPKEIKESFDQAQTGSLPTNWAQWGTGKEASFQVAAAKSLSGANVLTSTGASSVTAIAWPSGAQAADF